MQPDLVVVVLVGQSQQGVRRDPGAAADKHRQAVHGEHTTLQDRVRERVNLTDTELAAVGIAHPCVDTDRDLGVVQCRLSIAGYPPEARLRDFHGQDDL